MKLVKLDFTRLHNAEFGQLIDRLFNDIQQSGLEIDTNADFKLLLEALKEKIPTYTKALEQIRESEKTKKIAELDRMRDDDFTALRDSIKPYRKSRNENQKQAYNTLKIVFDEYKKAKEMNYEAKTKNINSFLSLLKSSDYQPSISVLKLSPFVQELEKSSSAFNELFAERSLQNIGKETLDTKILRKEMGEIYRKMGGYIETLSGISQDPFYKKAFDIINNSRKYFADLLAKREGINKVKKSGKDKEPKEI